MDPDSPPSPNSGPPSGPVIQRFDWTAEESAPAAVVRAVAAVSDRPPTDLPPLYDAVDPDALEAVVAGGPGAPAPSDVDVTFAFSEFLVTLSAGGEGYVLETNPDAAG